MFFGSLLHGKFFFIFSKFLSFNPMVLGVSCNFLLTAVIEKYMS